MDGKDSIVAFFAASQLSASRKPCFERWLTIPRTAAGRPHAANPKRADENGRLADLDFLRPAGRSSRRAQSWCCEQPQRLELGDMPLSIAHPRGPIVNCVIVRQRKNIEADLHKVADPDWMTSEIEGFVCRPEPIAICHDRFEVGEIYVAIDERRDTRREVLPFMQPTMLAGPCWIDRLPASAKSEVAADDNREILCRCRLGAEAELLGEAFPLCLRTCSGLSSPTDSATAARGWAWRISTSTAEHNKRFETKILPPPRSCDT